MPDPKTLKFEQELLNTKAIAGGLFAIVTDLMVAHAKVVGNSPNDGLLHARAVAEESLAKLEAEVRSPTGEFVNAGPSIRARVRVVLDAAESNARHMLALTPTSSTSN
ncbi:hypothetical protein ASD45_00140 [Pseudolabrys sp. Root1462]|uniref:hypothetical protein n=1 Tax=Pseudolabrys sp. Root1462 TaxID=1736466 RepID=UPI00070365FD|nr:hypothetical protein [Pseudolabrys sp. Root1462]KQY99382.1 hypothetical protein ASD45_00140 [Pseudolabrys sp. Root1462]